VVLNDVISLLARHLGRQPPSRRETEDIFVVAQAHPSVLAAMLATFEDLHTSVAEVVARRLGEDADEDAPQMIASMATDPDTPVPYVERAARILRGFVGSDNDNGAEVSRSRTAASRKDSTKAARR
jgi:MftR C-terminal domain